MKEDGGAWFEQILVDGGEDVDVVLGTDGARHDGVVVIDKLLEGTNGKGGATQLFQLLAFLLYVCESSFVRSHEKRWEKRE